MAAGLIPGRGLTIAAIAVASILAGCLAEIDDRSSRPESPVEATFAIADTKLVTPESFAGEPSVAVGPEGTIYITGPGGTTFPASAARLWVSHDDGVTFDYVEWLSADTGISNLPFGLEGDVAVDDAGNVYFTDLSGANAQLSSSDDQGRTWMMQTPAIFEIPEGDRPWLAAGSEGLVVVAWNQRATGYWIAVSSDGGQSFPTQTNLEGSGLVDDGGSFAGVPRVAPDGTIYAARLVDPVVTDDEGAWGPTLYRSTDGGESLTSHVVHPTANRTGWVFVVPAVDAAGNVYVVWAETDGSRLQVFYASSNDRGDTWNPPVLVGNPAGTTAMPWIAAGSPGHVAIAYYGAPMGQGNPDEVAEDAEWYPYVVDIWDAHTDTPHQSSLLLSNDPVLRGPMCVVGLSCTGPDAPSRSLGDYLMVDIAPDSTVHTAWTMSTSEGPRVWWASARSG